MTEEKMKNGTNKVNILNQSDFLSFPSFFLYTKNIKKSIIGWSNGRQERGQGERLLRSIVIFADTKNKSINMW